MNKMKFGLMAISFFMCACTCNRQQPPGTSTDSTKTVTNKSSNIPHVKEYAAFLNNLDTANVNNSGIAAQKYSALFANADSAIADSAFVLFFSFYDVMLNYLLDAHYKGGTINNAFTVSPDKGLMATTQNANRYLNKLETNGFTLGMAEGETYVKKDLGFVKQHFYPHVSSTMRIYLDQLYKEDKEGFLSDAALVITPTSLAERLLFWEAFLQQHPSFVFKEKIVESHREYLTFFLEGVDNTPLYDYESKTLSNAYASGFNYVTTKHGGSKLAAIVQPYYDALRSNEKSRAQKLLQQYRKQEIILDFSG